MTPNKLKNRLKAAHDKHEEPSRVRLHRTISWLTRVEQEPDDPDARFIFHWIAFNAAYARQFGFEQSERDQLQEFNNTLIRVDSSNQLSQALFQQFSGPIRVLIVNKFVFESFWRALREHDSSESWQKSFSYGKHRAMAAVMNNQTQVVFPSYSIGFTYYAINLYTAEQRGTVK